MNIYTRTFIPYCYYEFELYGLPIAVTHGPTSPRLLCGPPRPQAPLRFPMAQRRPHMGRGMGLCPGGAWGLISWHGHRQSAGNQ